MLDVEDPSIHIVKEDTKDNVRDLEKILGALPKFIRLAAQKEKVGV